MVYDVLECLILTELFEVGFAFILGIHDKDNLEWIVLVNAITNPLLVLSSWILMDVSGAEKGLWMTYVLLEPLVVFSEYLLYRNKLETRFHPLFLSFILNLVSILGGNLWRIMF